MATEKNDKEKNIEQLQNSLGVLNNGEQIVYFLTYDTKENPRASVKYIYDLAKTLNENGTKAKILVESQDYGGVSHWLGDTYQDLEVVSIKEDKVELNIHDILVVPEYYSNVLQQLTNVRCMKIMLVQQMEFIFETLPIGSKWSDFGFDRVITTTEAAKKYIQDVFPQVLVHIIPPIIGDHFVPSTLPLKPYVALSCRDRSIHKRVVSEFYLKYPQLRWITFRDMVQLSYEDFADNLKECMVSLWIDDSSTFGTFPLESIKCGIPVVGKIPNTEPDWLGENGMWTYSINKIVDVLATYILAWMDGSEISDDIKKNMKDTLEPYQTDITKHNIVNVFNSFKNKRIEAIEKALEKLTVKEEVE